MNQGKMQDKDATAVSPKEPSQRAKQEPSVEQLAEVFHTLRAEADEKASGDQMEVSVESYSIFTQTEKWCIIALVSYAAWFSTLTSFIYYPAIHQLSQTFAVSVDRINLTITTYMAVATVAPTLVGDAADVLGRRPVYVITLGLYMTANLAIALAKSYEALLGLRLLQALAISGMLCVAYNVSAANVPRNVLDCVWGDHRCCFPC